MTRGLARRGGLALLAGLALLLLPESAGRPARAFAARIAPSLPSQLPPAELARVRRVADEATLSTRVDGTPFVARREIFEYLLDHPEFASHVTRTLHLARYRIWRTPQGLFLDDGWGATGHFELVYADRQTRVMLAQGEYRQRLLPDIPGQAVVIIEYQTRPGADDRSTISTVVTGFVRLDSAPAAAISRLVGTRAAAKADKEAHRLVKVFARTTRAIDENPADVLAQLRQRPDVPARELAEFAELLRARRP
jgi:hypothetical protein